MAKVQRYVFLAVSFATVIAMSLSFSSCEKSTTEATTDVFVQGDLFPLTLNNKITFSGYLRHQVADTNITASGQVYATSWTILNPSTTAPGAPNGPGGPAALVADTTTVPTGVANPPTAKIFTAVFIKKESNGSFRYLSSIGRFKRTLAISGVDTLKFVLLADVTVPLGKTWTAYDSSFTSSAVGSARLEIVGKWEGTETLTLNGTTFSTYKLTTSRNVYIPSTAPTPAPGSGALTATVWIAPGVGPVKMILNADGESYGHFREFKSKVIN